ALVLLAMGSDALLAFPRRRLAVEVRLPPLLHVGEPQEIDVTIGAAGARAQSFEILAEQSGGLDAPQTAWAELMPGQPARIGLGLLARRRGRVQIERLWLRWQGPLGLVEKMAKVAVGSTLDVLPNIRGVQRAALQFFSREAIFGVKVQLDRGEGAEFD